MKKIILLIFIFSIHLGYTQSLEKEDFVIDVQMGLPNLSYFRSSISEGNHFFDQGSQTKKTHKSIGQFIVNAEFFLTDKMGLSIGANYGYYYDYNEFKNTTYSGNTNTSVTELYFTERKLNRYRIYIGPNFHLLRNERLDTYFGFKAGVKFLKIKVNDNLPQDLKYLGYDDRQFEFPVGLRICYGLRFFPTNNIAINTEFGLGGPLVSLGLSYKLTNN
jgi:hypothetical protein